MKRILIYSTVALLSFLGFIVAFAPASPFWGLVEADVKRQLPGLDLYTIDGTIWSGSARFKYRTFPQSRLAWDLAPLPLLAGTARLDVTANGDGHHIEGSGDIRPAGGEIRQISGFLHSSFINAASEPYGLTFPGRLDILGLALNLDQGWFTRASGNIHWDGGRIIYHTYRGAQVFDLPPLDGKLYLRQKQLALDIHHQEQTVLNVTLKPDGWARVDLKARLFELADLPWPEDLAPGDTVIQVEEQVLPGLSERAQ